MSHEVIIPRPEMKAEIVLITPEKARRYLDQNYLNRKVRMSWAKELADVITNNEFAATHQGIAISKTGRLLDGQHRLLAIIKANKPAYSLVVTNCDDSSFAFIDKGVKRSLSDSLQEPRNVTDVYSYFFTLAGYKADRPNLAQALSESELGSITKAIIGKCPATRRIASSAASKSAAVLAAYSTRNTEDIIANYANLVRCKYDQMTPALKNISKQIETGRIDVVNRGKASAFAKLYKAFHMLSEPCEIIRISDSETNQINAWARDLVKSTIRKV